MAKVKISYDVNERENASIVVDGVEFIGLGVTGYELKVAPGDADTECRIGFDFLGHEIEFDGRIVVNGLRLPLEVSSAIVKYLTDDLKESIIDEILERKENWVEKPVAEIYDDAIAAVKEMMAAFLTEVSNGHIFRG